MEESQLTYMFFTIERCGFRKNQNFRCAVPGGILTGRFSLIEVYLNDSRVQTKFMNIFRGAEG